MHFFRTLVISALLCASAASAATVPVGGWAGENDVEITVKIHHERPISEGAAIGVSERVLSTLMIKNFGCLNPCQDDGDCSFPCGICRYEHCVPQES